MQTEATDFDVIVVGYGPTGLVLASLLGQQGHRVAVVERWAHLYGKPRLTHIDGETARLVSLAADGEHALRDAWTTPHYYWTNGKGQLLMDVAMGNSRRMLWDDHLSVHLPHIEEAIHERISSLANVRLYRGHLATALEQDAEGVRLSVQPWRQGEQPSASHPASLALRARYLVGADGANSFIRESLGVERIDYGFNERWLCVDTEPLRPLPEKFNENAVQVCDPRRGYMFMPIGKKRQRFEFALLANEETAAMQTPEAAFRLLNEYHGLGAGDVSLIRHLVYTFECRLGRRWQVGRVLLAGDAVHTNPPYLGQGACSGMRDAANLAWKFDLVLRGLADQALLETYQLERLPHVRQLMLDARGLGQVANTANPLKAAVRDLLFRFKLTPKPKFPILTDGVLARDAAAKTLAAAGMLTAQGRLKVGDRTARYDDHVGFHFALVTRTSVEPLLAPDLRNAMRALGVRRLILDGSAGEQEELATDVDGVYLRMLDDLNADALLVRPDFVLYGHSQRDQLASLLVGLLRQLKIELPALEPQQRVSA